MNCIEIFIKLELNGTFIRPFLAALMKRYLFVHYFILSSYSDLQIFYFGDISTLDDFLF